MLSRKGLLTLCLSAVICLAAVPSLFAQVSVTAANPSAAAPGTVNLNVTISGSGFKKGAKAQFFLTGTTNPGDIAVTGTTFSSASQVVATINVSSTAVDASYDIQVQNMNGSSGKGTELFGVTQGNKPVTIPNVSVVATIYDYDASGNLLLLRSDNPGAQQASYSVSDPNVNSYVSGYPASSMFDLNLSNQTNRTVYLTFSSPVVGSGSGPAPLPDNWYNARIMTRCYDPSNNIVVIWDIPAVTTNNRCALRVAVTYNKVAYILVMSPIYPGTGYANVTCTAAAANSTDGKTPCGAWHVEPNLDPTTPGNVPTVAGLYYIGKGNSGEILVGYYKNTYRIDFHE